MAKVPSGYVPLDMNYLRDPDIRRAGAEAEHLFIRGLAHCKSGGTDGFIGDYDLEVVAVGLKSVPRRVAALVRVGLWLEADGGWTVRNWAKWNMSQAEIREGQERKREAAIKTNHERWHVPEQRIDPHCPHCSESLQRSVERPVKRVATGSLREEKTEGREDREKTERTDVAPVAVAPNAATLIGEWIDRCPERPPGRVVGQLSKEIKALLTEGIPVDTVRAGVEAWQSKSLHPSTLASVVHEVRNPATARPTSRRPTTDDRVQDGMALARRLAAEEANRLEIGA